jgi:hypothetical protein
MFSSKFKVPVIVIFTKCDAQIIKATNQLKEQGHKLRQAYREAPARVDAYLQTLVTHINGTDYPPAGHVCLRGALLCSNSIRG